MDKLNINGTDWVRLHDICDILRAVGEEPVFDNTDKVINQVARLMFYDAVQEAGEDEEAREAACELPGDFIVVHDLGHENPNGKRFIYFMEFEDGEGRAVDDGSKAMIFEYASMAQQVADKLQGEWRVFSVGREAGRITERLYNALTEDK